VVKAPADRRLVANRPTNVILGPVTLTSSFVVRNAPGQCFGC
jgi:hypothetical protein